MNELRVWSITVCSAALGCTALRLLAPRTSMGKLFGLITASFFLCCLVSPLTELRSLSDMQLPTVSLTVDSALSEQVQRQLSEEVEQTVIMLIRQWLEEQQTSVGKIEVMTECSDEGGIYMKQVTVYLDKQNEQTAEAVREVLEQQLQTTVVVKTEG